jgi:MFS family permease
VFHLSPFRLLTLHYALYQLSVALAGGFVGAYLISLGFSLHLALLGYATLLAIRCALRFIGLGVVRRIGYRPAMMLGAGVASFQFLPLIHADRLPFFMLWLVIVSVAEALYWPVYHAAVAVTGDSQRRGSELGMRTAAGAIIGVVGPLAGGTLLQRFGAQLDFALAAVLMAVSVLPLFKLARIDVGPAPSAKDPMQGLNRTALIAFAADGWMASGLAMVWPMVLFMSLGQHYEALGLANSTAGLAGAVAGLICGKAIDRGGQERYLVVVSLALGATFLLRACASWSPAAATIGNSMGAVAMGLYAPLLMSVIYERAKESGKAYCFHFAAEGGWDLGAALGCLAAALVAWLAPPPSLAMLPSLIGVAVLYYCLRESSAARLSAPSSV